MVRIPWKRKVPTTTLRIVALFTEAPPSRMEATAGRVVMVVGGPWGTSRGLGERADALLSLSRMTFTHEMCFLFLAEQLYRAFSILAGTGYHH